MTHLEEKKEEWLRKSVGGLNTKKEPRPRWGWVAQNVPKTWDSWDGEVIEHRILEVNGAGACFGNKEVIP